MDRTRVDIDKETTGRHQCHINSQVVDNYHPTKLYLAQIGYFLSVLNSVALFAPNQFISYACWSSDTAFSALTLLVGWQEGHAACKN